MEETDRKHDEHINPVPPDASGEGLPYAPENFPNEGDNWRWRVGKRVNVSGYHQDRYLYPPQRFQHLLKEIPTRGGGGFASMLSVKKFVESAFPGSDIDAFFESFTWKIRYKGSSSVELDDKSSVLEKMTTDSSIWCKAQNRRCSSLTRKTVQVRGMPCDICCSELGFCRECCCILCCKTVDNSFQGYSYIKCEAEVGDDYRCCHVAHLDCAVRAYMAGTVGGSIALDAQYYCRRCDAKTELVSHVARLLDTCKSCISSYDQLERVLNLGACVLHGSQKTSAKSLLAQIHQTLNKLKQGVALEEIWKRDNDSSSGLDHDDDHHYYNSLEQQQTRAGGRGRGSGSGSGDSCHSIQYLNLDKDVDKALEALRKAQESEYKAAEERLHGQREYLHELYQQLEYESSQLRKQRLSSNLIKAVSDRKHQIEREFNKLREMKQVAALGFARASKDILINHFGMEQEAPPDI